MAHTDACKIQVTQFVKKLTDTGMSVRDACKEAERESDGIPAETIRYWWKQIQRETVTEVGEDTPTPITTEKVITIPKIQVEHGGTREGAGRPQKYVPREKPTFNLTNASIEWAKWTWNPITGCQHGCSYCYARDMTKRYPETFPKGFEPHFIPARLEAPQNTPPPKTDALFDRLVFAVSMGDLFGDWVPQEWIDAVMDAVIQSPQWNYIFLTKNPKRYVDMRWPDNCWVGATVDCQDRVKPTVDAFRNLDETGLIPKVTFISVEPMLEAIKFQTFELEIFDWVIVGGQSQPGNQPALQPKWEWVESLLGQARKARCKVYFKPNLTIRPREYPE